MMTALPWHRANSPREALYYKQVLFWSYFEGISTILGLITNGYENQVHRTTESATHRFIEAVMK
jgi:hypothetical protein